MRISARAISQATALCLAAGYVDALGYIQYGGVFAANMTGNTVLLAISAAAGDWQKAVPHALALGAFLSGALISETLTRLLRRSSIALLLSAVPLIALYLASPEGRVALALLAFGMGLQGAAMVRFDGASLQTVVITGTLLKLIEAVVNRFVPPETGATAGSLWLFWLAWIAYGVGALLSYNAIAVVGPEMILLPILVLVPVAASLEFLPKRSGQ
jgi:uncharacterized membrane protein YoaK (UPF0700 family)